MKDPIMVEEEDGLLKSIPAWFAVFAAATYAIGFLVVFTFLNSMGVKESGMEAFKAKYVYVGLLYLQFPLSTGIVLLGLFSARRGGMLAPPESGLKSLCLKLPFGKRPRELSVTQPERKSKPKKMYAPTFWLIILILFDFYILIAFSPPGFFSQHQGQICILFAWGMIFLSQQDKIEHELMKRWNKKLERWHRYDLRVFVLVVSIIISVHLFRNMLPMLWNIFLDGGWLCLLIYCAVIAILNHVQKNRIKGFMLSASLCLPLSLVYFSILVFAYRIYPFIPAERGGGDFSTDRRYSMITFSSEADNAIPDPSELLANKTALPKESKPVIILDMSDNMLYVTLETSQKERESWRESGINNKPKVIYTIDRKIVSAIVYMPNPDSLQNRN